MTLRLLALHAAVLVSLAAAAGDTVQVEARDAAAEQAGERIGERARNWPTPLPPGRPAWPPRAPAGDRGGGRDDTGGNPCRTRSGKSLAPLSRHSDYEVTADNGQRYTFNFCKSLHPFCAGGMEEVRGVLVRVRGCFFLFCLVVFFLDPSASSSCTFYFWVFPEFYGTDHD
jgi:hypothetical protein